MFVITCLLQSDMTDAVFMILWPVVTISTCLFDSIIACRCCEWPPPIFLNIAYAMLPIIISLLLLDTVIVLLATLSGH